MTLEARLNKIISEQNISKREFAKRVGISENYLYILRLHHKQIYRISITDTEAIIHPPPREAHKPRP